jgi:stearoyl-CoA desaturase (delta-9 desaturase)
MNSDGAVRGQFVPSTFISILAIHLAACLAFIPYFFTWPGLILCLVLLWLSASLGISLTFHRLLAHGALRGVHPVLRTFLLCCASLTLEMGPIHWAATHRLHHRESDHEDDPHSPLASFWWGHIMWLFYRNPRVEDPGKLEELAPDLVRDPQLRWFDKWFWTIWAAVGILSWVAGYIIGTALAGPAYGVKLAWSLVVWGTLLRTVIVWHNTWFVNSATHLWGYRNYKTSDDSRNLWWVALVTFGEGWHNNHHAIAGSARFGHKWWEVDPTWWALCVFRALGWVKQTNFGPRNLTERKAFRGKVAALSAALKSRLPQGQRVALKTEG